jgi:Outer membrane protein beta-barrel domain
VVSRYWIIVWLAMLLSMPVAVRAEEELPIAMPSVASSYPETWPAEMQAVPSGPQHELREVPMAGSMNGPVMSDEMPAEEEWLAFWPKPHWFGLRHSSTHGRHANHGEPLVRTSWRNRPIYVGGQLGPMWFTESLDDDISTDTDLFGGVFVGWDTDHYWGHELHFDWSTPEFSNSQLPDSSRADSLFAWNYSVYYYPWGDTKFRPYWRAGIGNTHVNYPAAVGELHDEWLWTFPLGIGVKYPVKRWLAARMELTDYLSIDDGHPTQHNVALTFGLEWRFGAHPPSYWPWNPDRHIW